MYKNNKETLKLLLLIILVLAIPLFFISLEMLHNLQIVSAINPSEVLSNTLDDLYENISKIPKNNDASNIRNCLAEIFNLMNEKDFDKLYSLLTDDIKTSIFPTKEAFIDYMGNYLGDEIYSPNFSKYQKLNNEENDVFIVNVNYLPYSTSEEDIINSPVISKSDTFTIYLNEDLTYKFSFLKYIGTGKSNKNIYENELFSCKLLSTNLYMNQTIFNIEFTNKTDTDMFINSEEIYVVTGLMKKPYSPATLISANSTININFSIYSGLNIKDSLPKEIYFRGVHTNGNVYLFVVSIEYPVEL